MSPASSDGPGPWGTLGVDLLKHTDDQNGSIRLCHPSRRAPARSATRAHRTRWMRLGQRSRDGQLLQGRPRGIRGTHREGARDAGRGEQVGVVVRSLPTRVPLSQEAGGEAQGRGRLHRRELERQPLGGGEVPEGGARAVQALRGSEARDRGSVQRGAGIPEHGVLRLEGRARVRAPGGVHEREAAGGGHRPLRPLTVEVREARTKSELAAALALRERVFCGEQGVSFEADQDGRDSEATHIVAVDDGVVIGTCRLLFRGEVARLGRLAVERERRGENVAAEILREADRIATQAGSESIALHAQTYAQALYERAGYQEYGPTFVEEGIEHVAMEKRLARAQS